MAEAIGCVDDMRKNKSGNVFPGCDMNSIFESNGGFPDLKSSTAPNGPFSGANVHDISNPFNYTNIFYEEAQACCPQMNVDGPSRRINGASILIASVSSSTMNGDDNDEMIVAMMMVIMRSTRYDSMAFHH